MKKRAFAVFTAALLVCSFAFGAVASVDDKRPAKRRAKVRANPLVAMLPASDIVVTVNGKRFFGEALPKLLSANQKLLGEILAKLDAVESKTGVDLRRFDNFAAGVNIVKKSAADFDFDAVVVASGTIDSAAAVEGAKKAVDSRFREVSINGRSVYVFTTKDIADKFKQQSGDPNAAVKKVGRVYDIAISVLNGNTIVFGSLARVRETLEHSTSVDPEITRLLVKKAPAIINFAGTVPGGMSTFLPLDNDELGSNIDSIKTVYGSADTSADQATISVTGRTMRSQQAAALRGTFEGLRDLGKTILGSSKAADKRLYARLLANVRITTLANEINLDLSIPQSDVDALLAIVKK